MAHTLAPQLCMEKIPEHKVRFWRSSPLEDIMIGQSPNELVRQNEAFFFTWSNGAHVKTGVCALQMLNLAGMKALDLHKAERMARVIALISPGILVQRLIFKNKKGVEEVECE